MWIDDSLRPRAANLVPLTPIDFLLRAVEIYPDKPAVVAGDRRLTYRELGALTGRIAAALARAGIGAGDVVSVIATNSAEMLALHFAVPMIGAVLNAINTRLDADTIGYIFDHAESRLVIADAALAQLAGEAIQIAGNKPPLVVIGEAPSGGRSLADFIAGCSAAALTLDRMTDEWQPICLNYTSGTTGRPKGVVYHHRGAYLNSIGNLMTLGFNDRTHYLWTLPMFHCNGWQHPWSVTAAGGLHVCLDRIDPGAIFDLIDRHDITHFACAPIVLYMLLNHPARPDRRGRRRILVGTGGAAPTSALIGGLDALGIDIIHLYGLTESYGPATATAIREDWGVPSTEEKAALLARQGVRHPIVARADVVGDSGRSTPWDGETMGEIVLRSNTLMAGYYKDAKATEEAFAGGVFHTGDLAVRAPDGHIHIKDRAKDIIISGGENISSLEVESVLHQHPAVMLAAVVAVQDDKWGEVPCACLELKPGAAAPSHEELAAFCRARLAGFKTPRRFVFRELPKTATGKIQKFTLRRQLAATAH